MRIGVDLTAWTDDGGYGRFTRETLRALVQSQPNHEYYFFADPREIDSMDLPARNVRWCPVELSSPPLIAARNGGRPLMDHWRLWRKAKSIAKEEHLRAMFYPTVHSWFPAPLGLPSLVCVHDPILDPLLKMGLDKASRRRQLKWKSALARKRATALLCTSDWAKEQLSRTTGYDAGRIVVAPQAPSEVFQAPVTEAEIEAARTRANLPPGERYFVFVGSFHGHKNVQSLVRAHALLTRDMEKPPYLVLVGDETGEWFRTNVPDLRVAIRSGKTESIVRWTGQVTDEELRGLYAGSIANCLPSYVESFGLTAVEAAACGVPSLVTTQSPLPELLGEEGCLPIDPHNLATLVSALEESMSSEERRAAMGAVAREAVSHLDWRHTAQKVSISLADISRRVRFPLLPWIAAS